MLFGGQEVKKFMREAVRKNRLGARIRSHPDDTVNVAMDNEDERGGDEEEVEGTQWGQRAEEWIGCQSAAGRVHAATSEDVYNEKGTIEGEGNQEK